MNDKCNSRLTKISQVLRKNMTKEERRLWYDFLKDLPQTVNRQKVIGGYIVDFYCASAKIVIELDGSQHYDKQQMVESNKIRDEFLKQMGITVLRYSNYDIKTNFDGVRLDILQHIKSMSNEVF